MMKIKIKGRRPEKILERLTDINIYSIKKEKDGIVIKIKEKDLKKIEKRKTIYDLEIISTGKLKLSKIFLSGILFSILVVIFFSSLIFNINIVTNNEGLKNEINNILKDNNIKKYYFKPKDTNYLEKIIKEKLKDKIEWINIELNGTNLIIKLEEKILEEVKEKINYRHIVAKKNAIIRKFEINSGEIIVSNNSYVKKGDIIVSGIVNNLKVVSTGKVYGEVWYKAKIKYPLLYSDTYKKGNYEIKIDYLKDNDDAILKLNFYPFSIRLIKTKEKEIETILTYEEAKEKAKEKLREKINRQLNDNEYIISEKQLKQNINNSKIELEIFYTIYEDITEYLEIKE